MLTSEGDALGKWCPFARVDGNNRLNKAPADGPETIPEPFRCIGAKCMAWREIQTSHLKGAAGKLAQGNGYCGLSGPLVERF